MNGLVLIVEDAKADAERLASGLRLRQWTVEVIDDGLSALGRLRVEPKPIALVLDLALPSIDGYALFHELSSNSVFQRLPVVVVSGATMIDHDMLEGAAAILSKPRDAAGWDPLLDDLHSALSSIRR